ncbi:MAG: TolB family protein, partial [Cyanobacteriota bacterium]
MEVISAAQLGPARAAYASANGTIYLSDRFLAAASQEQLQAALLEEYGHAIDARVNVSDRPGDEGELFSLRVRGLTPSSSERLRILAEDDRRSLTINGVTLQVEQAAPVVYETTTIAGSSDSSGSGSYGYIDDIVLSGLNAAWQERRGRLSLLNLFNGSIVSTIATSAYQSFGDIAISGGTVVYTKSNGAGELGLEVYRTSAGVTTRLTNNTNFDGDLLIDGNTVVWQSYDTTTGIGDIYRHNGTTTFRVTNNTVQEEDVQISGSTILWAASDGNDHEIYLLNGAITQQLTNNTLEDYSPVLSGNRAAWLQWNNGQENLFFYNGSTTTQVTTNKEVADPVISGGNLIYKQREANGDTSLKLYYATTLATTTLTNNLGYDDIQASGNLVAWVEPVSGSNLSTLKLFNGTSTTTIASNVLSVVSISDGKVVYIGNVSYSSSSYRVELFLYNSATPTAGTVQLTSDAGLSPYELNQAQIVDNRILWTDGEDFLKLTQPTTKPILSFTTP